MSRFIDLTGERFGRLVVIKRVGKNKQGKSLWLCRCDCGNEIIVRGSDLKSGNTKSCGCLQKEKSSTCNTKHGHSDTEIYRSWHDMIRRCNNPNCKQYKDYGGRGIQVCKRWMKFENFLEDMINSWEPGLTLERTDNKRGYYPDNCEWVTRQEQQRNTRRNHLITYNNKTQCIAAWSEETGISAATIRWRLKQGWSPERALTEPIRKRSSKTNS